MGKEEVQATSACSDDEISKIKALPQDTSATSFGGKSATCGKSAFSIFSGFSDDKFNTCLTSAVGISTSCSTCYAKAGEYGASNCKSKCLFGWCSEGCLACTSSAEAKAATCSGVPVTKLKPCSSVKEEVQATSACSDDEISKIKALPQDTSATSFGGKSATCGKSAYSVFHGFSDDKFNTCLTSAVGISTSCSTCYAKAGEYGASNCKSKCLFGWCSEGCLACTSSAQAKAATCSGVPVTKLKPCSSEQEEV